MAEARGIEETKDILDFMFSFVEAVGKAQKDGEMSFMHKSDHRICAEGWIKLFYLMLYAPRFDRQTHQLRFRNIQPAAAVQVTRAEPSSLTALAGCILRKRFWCP